MAKPQRPEVEYHYVRRTMTQEERQSAIRQGYNDYQCFGWDKDPPYPEGAPRRWHWQDGAEAAEEFRRTGLGGMERAPGWH